MTFQNAIWLTALIIPVAGATLYLAAIRRARRYTINYTDLTLLERATSGLPIRLRHIPALLAWSALIVLVLAAARPQMETTVIDDQSTIYLALDVSISMDADDVQPTRLEAAQRAAREFVGNLPSDTRVSLIGFAGSASLLVAPTTDRAPVQGAIDNLSLFPGTAIGEAIFTALDAMSLENEDAAAASHIVLLSDGETTFGRPNHQAVAAAREAGVGVSTIAFGTPNGVITYGGERLAVPVDSRALQGIAVETGGEFTAAGDLDTLIEALMDLGTTAITTTEQADVADRFAVAALALLTAAGIVQFFTATWTPAAPVDGKTRLGGRSARSPEPTPPVPGTTRSSRSSVRNPPLRP